MAAGTFTMFGAGLLVLGWHRFTTRRRTRSYKVRFSFTLVKVLLFFCNTSSRSSGYANSVLELASKGKTMPDCTGSGSICNASVWIGLRSIANTPEFEWRDSSPLNFTAWAPGRPHPELLNTTALSYGSIIADLVDTPDATGQQLVGKWDHLAAKWASLAAVCKREY